MNMDKEQLVRFIVKYQSRYFLKKAINHFGLEGTEDAINRNYKNNPKLKNIMLNELHRMWKNK